MLFPTSGSSSFSIVFLRKAERRPPNSLEPSTLPEIRLARQTRLRLVPSRPKGGHRPDADSGRCVHSLGSALVDIVGSRSCGRTVNASSAEERAMPAVVRPPCSSRCPPRSIRRLPLSIALLDGAWAVRPLAFVRERGQSILVLEDTPQRAAGPSVRGAHA